MGKVILITGGALKERLTKKVLACLFPDQDFEIINSEIKTSSVHIISKKDCLEMMQADILKAKELYPDAKYYIFMRGRFDDLGSSMEEAALVLVRDSLGNEGVSQAASFQVPEVLAQKVRSHVPWSKAVEEVFNKTGVKEGSGYVGILTKGHLSKEDQYFQPLMIALSTCRMGKLGD